MQNAAFTVDIVVSSWERFRSNPIHHRSTWTARTDRQSQATNGRRFARPEEDHGGNLFQKFLSFHQKSLNAVQQGPRPPPDGLFSLGFLSFLFLALVLGFSAKNVGSLRNRDGLLPVQNARLHEPGRRRPVEAV